MGRKMGVKNVYRREARFCWPRCPEHIEGCLVCWHEDADTGRCKLLTDTDFGGRECPFMTLDVKTWEYLQNGE